MPVHDTCPPGSRPPRSQQPRTSAAIPNLLSPQTRMSAFGTATPALPSQKQTCGSAATIGWGSLRRSAVVGSWAVSTPEDKCRGLACYHRGRTRLVGLVSGVSIHAFETEDRLRERDGLSSWWGTWSDRCRH